MRQILEVLKANWKTTALGTPALVIAAFAAWNHPLTLAQTGVIMGVTQWLVAAFSADAKSTTQTAIPVTTTPTAIQPPT
jgi:hypothetical protein